VDAAAAIIAEVEVEVMKEVQTHIMEQVEVVDMVLLVQLELEPIQEREVVYMETRR
jgi:hypothetical protein